MKSGDAAFFRPVAVLIEPGPDSNCQDSQIAAPPAYTRRPWHPAFIVSGTVGLFLLLAFAMALTKKPWVDEAWFAIPAWNLVTHGYMGTTILETAGTHFSGLERYTYWIMPLHLLAQAAWYSVWGFGLLPMRGLSITWGLVLLASLYMILKDLSDRAAVARLAILLTATDFVFVRGACDGRMDMMNAALGFAALAAYAHFRAASVARAILVSQSLATASVFTHPNGIWPVAALGVLTLYLDRHRLRPAHVLIAGAPYAAALATWGLYILKAPALFLAQLGEHAGGRWQGIGSLVTHVRDTYAAGFGLQAHWAGAVVHLKALVLITYVIGVAGVLLTPALGRQRGYRALLLLTAVYFAGMTLFWSPNAHDYLVHIVPLYAALLAAWLEWCWTRHLLPRWLLAMAVMGLVLLQSGGTVQRAMFNPYQNEYLPAVEFLQTRAGPSDVIMASAEFGFALGFDRPLIDDVRLGYHSGKRPDFIVVETRYEGWFQEFVEKEPDISRHVNALLEDGYRPIYRRGGYAIYARRS